MSIYTGDDYGGTNAAHEARTVQAMPRRVQMTEAQLVDVIVEAAQLYGWCVSHFRPALSMKGWRTPLQGDAGLPDLVLARRGVVLLREVKVGRNRLSPAQERWRDAIGEQWGLWTDKDLDAIMRELR